jgi:hypothetical protein
MLVINESYPFWQLSYAITLNKNYAGHYIKLIGGLNGWHYLLIKANGCARLINTAGEEMEPHPNEMFIVADIDNI